jgi:protocatechuate 3,4-dioxygenase beta subunit
MEERIREVRVSIVLSLLLAISATQGSQEAFGTLSGRVVADGTNAPVADARIIVMPTGPRTRPLPAGPIGPPPQATTDSDGRFTFPHLRVGTYRIDVQKTGFAPLAEMGQPGPTTQIAANQSASIELRVKKGAVIAGRVLDAAGEPMPDVHVMAMRRMQGSAAMRAPAGTAPRLLPAGPGGQTNDLGEFRVTGLAAGEYYIAASPRANIGFGGPAVDPPATTTTAIATTYYPGTIDQAAAMPIAVAAAETAANITVAMQSAPAFRISGVVVDEDGKPVGGAMVMLMADPRSGAFMGPSGGVRTRDDGRFSIGGVTPGAYQVNASIPMMMGGGGGAGSATTVTRDSAASTTWTSIGGRESTNQPVEVVVADTNVTGLRIVVHR